MSPTEPEWEERTEAGFVLIEVVVAMTVLLTAIVGLLMGFLGAQKLSLSAEKQAAMSQVAQRELERIQGVPYAAIALTVTPVVAAAQTDPDSRVAAGPPATYTPVGSSTAEPLVIDASRGTLAPAQNWSAGGFSGAIDTFITWVSDPSCAPGCPATQDYKRITVAVTMDGASAPSAVYTSSVIADPNAAPAQGTANGTAGNPISNGATTCQSVTGTTTTQGTCEAPIVAGVPNTLFLHDCAATASLCAAPSASHAVDPTVGAAAASTGLICSTTLTLASQITAATTGGCPTPDRMDPSPPSGANSSLQYSTDLGTTGYQGGRLLQPFCTGTGGCGSGQTADCTSGSAWSNTLLNAQNALWVTAPVATSTSLTGVGALNLFTQTQNGTSAVVTLCVQIYSIPPSGGIPGSLADLLAWPPIALGGAGYVAATNPSSGSNWPTSPSTVEYSFTYAGGGVTVPAGNRIGLRVWMAASVNNALALLYDSTAYPTELQLNSQSAIAFSS